jgi:hypothetical protein
MDQLRARAGGRPPARIDIRDPRYRALFWASACALTLGIVWWYLRSFNWEYPRLTLQGMLYGTAHRPFVGRALVPLVARVIIELLPVGGRETMSALVYLSLLGFVWALRYLAHAFWPPSARLDGAVLFSLLGLAPLMFAHRLIYDFTTLFLFTLCLALMVRERWAAFLAIYVLSCVNRETTVLLSAVFLAGFYDRLPIRRLAALTATQGLIFLLIRGALAWQFRDNPGGSFEFNLLFQLLIHYHMPLETAAHVLLGAAALMLVAHGFRRKPLFLRRAFLVLAPSLMALYLLFGNPWEIRVFYELYPVGFLLAWKPGWLEAPASAAPRS